MQYGPGEVQTVRYGKVERRFGVGKMRYLSDPQDSGSRWGKHTQLPTRGRQNGRVALQLPSWLPSSPHGLAARRWPPVATPGPVVARFVVSDSRNGFHPTRTTPPGHPQSPTASRTWLSDANMHMNMLRIACGRTAVLRPHRVALAAAATASAGAAVAFCDSSSSAKTVPFVLGGEQHDQSTFSGRLTKIQELIDMRTLLTTDAQLAVAQDRLAKYKLLGRLPDGASDEDMWAAQRTVSAVVHGPTGEKMFWAGRMSMFIPANLPIAAGMLISKSTGAQLFWQWYAASPTLDQHPCLA